MQTANKIKLVSDRVERAKALLLSQFKGSPNINTVVEVLVTELQELENVLNDVQTVRTLAGSYGVWLDEIGRQLKVDRGSYNDNDYKTAIKLEMFRKTASATKEDIRRVIELLTGDTEATITNKHPYMSEITSFLYCIGDDNIGLDLIARLFPTNTALKINKKFRNSFAFGTAGRGFNSGSSLNSLAYHNYGISGDNRFTSRLEIPPPIVIPAAPNNVSRPLIIGEVVLNQPLTCTTGGWVGDEPITYTYQWLRNNVPVSGETSSSYTITTADLSSEISCTVTASNAVGTVTAQSNFITVSDTPALPSSVAPDLGLNDLYTVVTTTQGSSVTAQWTLTFNPDGTVRKQDQLDTTANWLESGDASDYTIEYSIVNGSLLGLSPNVPYPLTTARMFGEDFVSNTNGVKNGRYVFTIRSTLDPTFAVSKTILTSLEVVDINM